MTAMTQKNTIRNRIKQSDARWARVLKRSLYSWRYGHFPYVRFFHQPLYTIHVSLVSLGQQLTQKLYFTPLFKSRLKQVPSTIQLYSGMPQLIGPLELSLGEHCRISGVTSFFGRSSSKKVPVCFIGENVDVGWQSTIAVGRTVRIGNNVRIAGRCYLAGFPGHPEDPNDRAKGLPETEEQIGDIVLEENVWLATGVTVLAGVTIGRNSIIAAGSVVTKSIPSDVVAGGVPAIVLRTIQKNEEDVNDPK